MKKASLARAVPVLLALCGSALVACGGPVPGKPCSKAGYQCLDKANAAECRDGTWVELPCRGSGGCALSGGIVSCDMSANVPGDACASAEEGQGACSQDGKALFECRSGTLTKTRTCSSCSINGNQVVCQP